MDRELASIKDGGEVVGFVVYDEVMAETQILVIDEAKESAALGNMDTLYYKDGKFIPIIKGRLAGELKRKFMLHNYEKICEGMTFEEFVDADCIFRKKDVDLMLCHQDVVLANVCLAMDARVGDKSNWFLTVAFWSKHSEAMNRVKEVLSEYMPYLKRFGKMRQYDNFIMMNLPLADPKCGFDLLTFQKKTGLNFVYNPVTLDNMDERINLMTRTVPRLFRKMFDKLKPTSGALAGLKGIIREANRISSVALSARGIKNDLMPHVDEYC